MQKIHFYGPNMDYTHCSFCHEIFVAIVCGEPWWRQKKVWPKQEIAKFLHTMKSGFLRALADTKDNVVSWQNKMNNATRFSLVKQNRLTQQKIPEICC